MYNHRLLQVVAVVVALMAVAATSGMAAASAPAGSERNMAASSCLAISHQEMGTVLPSAWYGYQENGCSTTGGMSVGLAALGNPNGQWIGPETVAAAEKAFKADTYGPPGR